MSSGATRQTGQRSQENEDTSTEASDGIWSVMRYLRWGSSSGLFAGIAGLVTVRTVRRALREGSSERATRHAMMAVFWIGVAMTQWGINRSGDQGGRHRDVGATDVVDTAPDIEEISSGSNADEPSGDSTSIDVTERSPAPDVEGDASDSDVDESDVVGTEPNVADIVDAEGTERAEDAEGMEDVEDAEGVTDLDETKDAEDDDEEAG